LLALWVGTVGSGGLSNLSILLTLWVGTVGSGGHNIVDLNYDTI